MGLLGSADKHLVFTAAKEILIKALENSNPFATAFNVEKANEVGDVFNALATKISQSFMKI